MRQARALYHPAVIQAIAEPRIPPKSCVTSSSGQRARAQIDLKLKSFAETGVGDVKALKGAPGMRLRSGDWRVLFTIKANTITIHAVGHRRDIYE